MMRPLSKILICMSIFLLFNASVEVKAVNDSNEKNEVDYDKILIVAHPDDEFLFGYSQLIKEEGWFVFVFTNADNPKRKKEFEAMMEALNVKNYKMYDFHDQWTDVSWDQELAVYLLKNIINQREDWKMVVTHNDFGDYGHNQHQLVNQLVHQAYLGRNLYEFGDIFRLDQRFTMDKKMREEKKKLLELHYPSQLKGLKTSVWFENSNVSYLMKVR